MQPSSFPTLGSIAATGFSFVAALFALLLVMPDLNLPSWLMGTTIIAGSLLSLIAPIRFIGAGDGSRAGVFRRSCFVGVLAWLVLAGAAGVKHLALTRAMTAMSPEDRDPPGGMAALAIGESLCGALFWGSLVLGVVCGVVGLWGSLRRKSALEE